MGPQSALEAECLVTPPMPFWATAFDTANGAPWRQRIIAARVSFLTHKKKIFYLGVLLLVNIQAEPSKYKYTKTGHDNHKK